MKNENTAGKAPATLPPSAVVGHVVPVICCRRENFFPKTFPYYEN